MITMSGQAEIWKKLSTLPTDVRRQCASELGAKQVLNIKERVAEREGIRGGKYPASKRALREGGQTLEDTGEMIKALAVKSTTADEVVIGFGSAAEAQKAVWNQYGTRAFSTSKAFPILKNGGVSPRVKANIIAWSRKKGRTPPRQFFGVSRSDYQKLIVTATNFYRSAIARLGLS